MEKKILLIGVGNIGKRHLQSCLQIKNIQIDCIEKNKIKILNLKKIFYKFKNLNFFYNLNGIEKKYDVIIDARTSKSRFSLLKKILKKTNTKKLLMEKFLFQNIEDYYKFNNIIFKKKIAAFVNCPMRTYEAFNFLKKKIKKNFFLLNITGSNWNLCSNSIHYLDLFNYFDQTSAKYNITPCLKNKIRKSKRNSFLEFDGKIVINSKKNKLELIHNKKFKYNEKIILTCNNNEKYTIFFKKKNIYIFSKNKKYIFKLPLQSQETSKFIKKKKVKLLKYSKSSILHILLLNQFLKHYRKLKKNKKIKFLPIT